MHPELISGAFKCSDCNSFIPNVTQQFRYTQPTICTNPQCQNRRRFALDIEQSKFVDFQKVRVQETQAEIPLGSIPRRFAITFHSIIFRSCFLRPPPPLQKEDSFAKWKILMCLTVELFLYRGRNFFLGSLKICSRSNLIFHGLTFEFFLSSGRFL